MGLMKNLAILNFGKTDSESSVALGTIPIRKAVLRPTPEICAAGTQNSWAYIITKDSEIIEDADFGIFTDSQRARECALVKALCRLSTLCIGEPIATVKVFTKHKTLFSAIEQKVFTDPSFELSAEMIETDDISRGYFLARVDYLSEHPKSKV